VGFNMIYWWCGRG